MISTDIYSTDGDVFSVQIDSNSTIYDLKMYLEMKYKISAKNINLIFQNKCLNDTMRLESFNFDQFPGIMIESIDISKPEIFDDKDKRTMFSNLNNFISNLEEIKNFGKIPCAQFSLNYSFTKSVPVTFISLDPSLNKTAILNSCTKIDEVFNMMNLNHSQYNLYSIRRILYDNEKLSDIGIFKQYSLRAYQNIKSKSEKLSELKICNNSDDPFYVPASANMLVSELKEYIAFRNCKGKKENIILLYTDILLNDQKRISYYKIPNKATLNYSIIDQESYVVALIFGNFASADFTFKDRSIKIRKFQDMVANSSSIPASEMFLFHDNILIKNIDKTFRDLTEKNQIELELRTKNDPFYMIKSNENKDIFYKIDVKKNDTIFNIKRKICDLFDVLIGDQVLIYNNFELDNSLLVNECGIEFGSVLELNLIPVPSCFSISFFYKGQTFSFSSIHQDLYIRDLKQMIKEKTKDPIDEIEIAIQPRKLENNDILSDLCIKGGLSLFLCPKFTPLNVNIITIMNDNFNFLVFPEMTIKMFKQALDYVLGNINQQLSIFFNGKQIQDEYTFQYIGVTENSTLYILVQ